MQYRGKSLPLVALSDAASVTSLDNMQGDAAVIVFNVQGREVGLVGTLPVDVIETSYVMDQTTHRQKGIFGSAVIHEKTTLFVNLMELVETAYPEWGLESTKKEVL